MLEFFFSPAGTVDRRSFTLGWLFWLAVEGALLLMLINAGEDGPGNSLATLMLVAVSIVDTVSVAILAAKRARTLGWPPMLGLMTLIPVVSLITVLVLSGLRTRDEEARGMPMF
ncbi:MAG: DUF805 domain-containing protein [Rhizobiaceae bacterium]|jgi:uncharacterized membrane protein YhaH (DUF805 family)|nr:DUF805 domain-containing protein [Rhizobiaceae bacterium]